MKAILVINMPKSCEECNYCGFYQDDVDERACLLMESHFIGKLTEGERDVVCPLRPLPQKRILPKEMTEGTNYGEEPWFSDGFNACLDEILGEKE